MPTAHLTNRGVVLVSGEDASAFLQGLITADVETMKPGEGHLAALLTPQGKILFDFIITYAPFGLLVPEGAKAPDGAAPLRDLQGYFLDAPAATVADLVKRLNFYKLRAKVQVEQVFEFNERLAVLAIWGEHFNQVGAIRFRDGRHPDLGDRLIFWEHDVAACSFNEPEEYDAHRIGLGVPEGGKDFAFGDLFPHDADMDQLGGVDFAKGCFIGQEVVSRMQHRGTARRRFVRASASAALPVAGTPVVADGKAIGALGSSAGRVGLALVRLDRAKEAMNAGVPITADGVALALTLPDWAKFTWPTIVAEEN